MTKTPAKQPFLSITVFALLLMGALLYMQTRSDNSIRDLQNGNALSSVTFRANDSLAEIIQDINVIETAIRQNIIAGRLHEGKGIQDTINLLRREVNNIRLLTASIANKKYLDDLSDYVNKKMTLYKKIYESDANVAAARAMLISDSNKILNENIYVAAQNIQLQLENDLQASIQKNTVVSAKVLWLSRLLTILALTAILILATLIIRHLFKNVTLIQDLENEKHKTQEAANIKEQFLANMSHEIRTPVNAITGFTSLLQKSELKPEQKEFVNIIKNASNNLYNIVNDILDISKIEAGMAQVYKSVFNVKELLYEMEMLFTYAAKEKGLEIVCHIDKQVPPALKGDDEKLKQVLTNLISNAIKFTEKGTIKITVHATAVTDTIASIAFSIKDNGIGIPKGKQETIFERFEQADAQTTRNYGGTGLGLAIVKKLVTLQGGNIMLNSTDKEGAEFIITIPYEIPVHENETLVSKIFETNNAQVQLLFSDKIRILAAEDNKMNQLLLAYIFRQWNIKPHIVNNGMNAIETLKSNTYDLIFMDIQMPEMDGYAAVQHLRKTLQVTTPIIAMTAHALPGEKEKCLAAGMDDYLPKPIMEEELIYLMNKYLPRHLTEKKPVSEKYIDVEELKNTFGNNDVFVKNIITQFLIQFPEEVATLQYAYLQKDFKKVQAIAHSLKTTVSSVNATSSFMPALEILESAFSYNTNELLLTSSLNEITDAVEAVKTQAKLLLENS